MGIEIPNIRNIIKISEDNKYSCKEVRFSNPVVSSIQNIEPEGKGRKVVRKRRYSEDIIDAQDDCIDDPFGLGFCLWAWVVTTM